MGRGQTSPRRLTGGAAGSEFCFAARNPRNGADHGNGRHAFCVLPGWPASFRPGTWEVKCYVYRRWNARRHSADCHRHLDVARPDDRLIPIGCRRRRGEEFTCRRRQPSARSHQHKRSTDAEPRTLAGALSFRFDSSSPRLCTSVRCCSVTVTRARVSSGATRPPPSSVRPRRRSRRRCCPRTQSPELILGLSSEACSTMRRGRVRTDKSKR